jgi:hypothetical protein
VTRVTLGIGGGRECSQPFLFPCYVRRWVLLLLLTRAAVFGGLWGAAGGGCGDGVTVRRSFLSSPLAPQFTLASPCRPPLALANSP